VVEHGLPMMTGPRYLRRGFTLVEVMVAVAILATGCALTFGAFHPTFQAKAIIEKNASRHPTVRLAVGRMSREISMAFVSQNDDPTMPERRTFFVGKRRGDIDELRFSMFGHQRLYADADEADTSQVAYYGGHDRNDSHVLNLLRRETRRLG